MYLPSFGLTGLLVENEPEKNCRDRGTIMGVCAHSLFLVLLWDLKTMIAAVNISHAISYISPPNGSLVPKYLLLSQIITGQLFRPDLQQLNTSFHWVGFQKLQRKMKYQHILGFLGVLPSCTDDCKYNSPQRWHNTIKSNLYYLLNNLFGHSGVFQTVNLNRSQENEKPIQWVWGS